MKSNCHFKLEDLQVYQKANDFGEYVDNLVKTLQILRIKKL